MIEMPKNIFNNVIKKPDDLTENQLKEFNEGGIFFLEKTTLKELVEETAPGANADECFEQVDIEALVPIAMPEAFKLSLSVVNRATGRKVYFSNFSFTKVNEETTVISFKASMVLPEGVKRIKHSNLCLSYLDLCYGGAAELSSTKPDSDIPLRAGSEYRDVGWVISSRFTDTLIEAMGKINDTIFNGILTESVIYIGE